MRAEALEPSRFRARPRGHVQRDGLTAGTRVIGPARIEELSGTTWVPGGWAADVLGDRTLRLRRAQR